MHANPVTSGTNGVKFVGKTEVNLQVVVDT